MISNNDKLLVNNKNNNNITIMDTNLQTALKTVIIYEIFKEKKNIRNFRTFVDQSNVLVIY